MFEYVCVDNDYIKSCFDSKEDAINYAKELDNATRGQERCSVYEITSIKELFSLSNLTMQKFDKKIDSSEKNDANWYYNMKAVGVKSSNTLKEQELIDWDYYAYPIDPTIKLNKFSWLQGKFINVADNVITRIEDYYYDIKKQLENEENTGEQKNIYIKAMNEEITSLKTFKNNLKEFKIKEIYY